VIITTTTTTVVAVKVQKFPWTDFLTSDKFKCAPEKRLNGQSEVFYFTANENPRDHYKLRTAKVVSMMKNKDMLICLPFV